MTATRHDAEAHLADTGESHRPLLRSLCWLTRFYSPRQSPSGHRQARLTRDFHPIQPCRTVLEALSLNSHRVWMDVYLCQQSMGPCAQLSDLPTRKRVIDNWHKYLESRVPLHKHHQNTLHFAHFDQHQDETLYFIPALHNLYAYTCGRRASDS